VIRRRAPARGSPLISHEQSRAPARYPASTTRSTPKCPRSTRSARPLRAALCDASVRYLPAEGLAAGNDRCGGPHKAAARRSAGSLLASVRGLPASADHEFGPQPRELSALYPPADPDFAGEL